jgi:FkbM family methyltransferase
MTAKRPQDGISFVVQAGSRCYSFAAPEGDSIGEYMQRFGRPYEYDLLRTLAPFIRHRSVVVDVGANLGSHAVYFALVRGAVVHAYEPNPEARRWLHRNASTNDLGHIFVHEEALSDAPGRAHVLAAEDLGLAQMVTDETGEVEVRRLDDFEFTRQARIVLIKIDVEGAEAKVLEGAKGTVRQHRPLIAVEARDLRAREKIDSSLGSHGYHRFPLSFAYTPTYIYYPHPLYFPVLLASAGIAKTRESWLVLGAGR